MENKMKLVFSGKSENESFARAAAGAFAAQLDPTIDEISDIKTAVSEAVTNAIVHGYRDFRGDVTMEITIKGSLLAITVSDNGIGIEDIELAMQPFYTGGNSEERSGMGFTVMETFMDTLDVASSPGKGTVVTMTKRIQGKE